MNEPNQREEAFFEAALALAPDQRAAYLASVCGDDAQLRERVEALLKAHAQTTGILGDAASFSAASTIVLDLPLTEKPGDRIGRYKLLQQIGEGGCGVVYMAEQQEPVKRLVAFKVIKPGMDTRQVLARFEAERQALALMSHPNIAKVLDAGATETGRPYFVMELVRGVRITDYCDDLQNSLSTEKRLGLFIQVCRAVQHAHQKGIIHRDIKPSNILVTLQEDGTPTPKVIDFGIAKATTGQTLTDKTLFTAFEQFIGTPAYMSPEQAQLTAIDIDTRSDIYSLGVLLYELLIGRTPFDTQRLFQAGLDEIRRIIREEEPPRPSTRLSKLGADEQTTLAKRRQSDPAKLTHVLRGDLDWIVMKCLEKDRTRRYETANGLVRDIERHLGNEPIVARPPSNLYRFQKMVRRNKVTFAAAAAVSMALVLGAVVSISQAIRATRAVRDQSRLRQAAEQAREQEANQRQKAQAAALEARNALAASDFRQACKLSSEGNAVDALAYLSRSLSLNPSDDAALVRLTTLLTYHRWMLPVLTLEHSAPVRSARFSRDGKRIFTASADGAARVWDAQSGEPLSEPRKYGDMVSAAQFDGVSPAEFSPDGKQIVTVSGDTARVWDAQSGQPLTEPLKHNGHVYSARFSPDGKRVVTASFDNTAQVWDAQTGQPLGQPLKHTEFVWSAQFSPDGKRVVTASFDGTARVWDAQTGQPLSEPLKHKSGIGGWVYSACFSPDGTRIVTASADHTARIWDCQSGQELTKPLNHVAEVNSALFSPDGKQVVTVAKDGSARVWDAQSGEPLNEPVKHGDVVNSAEFSPEGGRIVTASDDNRALVWDSRSAGQALSEPVQRDEFPRSPEFSPDGKRIVKRSGYTAWVCDSQSGLLLTKPLRHSDAILSARFSPNGERIVTASSDNTARVWDALTGEALSPPLRHNREASAGVSGHVTSAQFSPDGRRIVTASYDYTARVWDAQSGQPLAGPLQHGMWVNSAEFSPDGKRIVTASRDRTARVWDAQSGQPLTEPLKHSDIVTSAHFSLDGKRIVTATWDGIARVWDAQSGQPVTEPMKSGTVLWAQFSPDGKRLVTASGDAVRLWDVESGQSLSEPLKHSGSVFWVQFSPDGWRIVTVSRDGTARAWDTAPSGAPPPDWLSDLVAAVGGRVLNKNGVPEQTQSERARTIRDIRQKLQQQPGDDEWARWGRWFLSDHSTRTISPFSKMTVAEYVQNRLSEGTQQSLDEAERAAEGSSEQTERISVVRIAFQQRTNAQALAAQGKLTEAAALFSTRLSLLRNVLPPDDPGLASAIADLVSALLNVGKFSEAEPLARECIAIRENKLPGDWTTLNASSLLGRSLLGQKKFADAEPLLVSAYEGLKEREVMIPDAGRHCINDSFLALVQLYEAAGEPNKAAALSARKKAEAEAIDRERAEELRPRVEALLQQGEPTAQNDLAWLLSTCDISTERDGPSAVALAEKAVAATNRKNDMFLDTLAAAYAETGQYEKAVSVQKEAIALGSEQYKDDYLARLKLYESNAPYRDATR